MNSLIRITIAILVCLSGSLLMPENALGAKPVKVTSVVPDSGSQGETLNNVHIRGSGFDNHSTVRFLVGGTDVDALVEPVGEIELVNGELVVPTLLVHDDATVDFYDVEVTTSSGRRGKGTDLFRVTEPGGGSGEHTFAAKVTFDDLAGDSIASDDGSPYVDGVGVGATMPVEFSPPGQFVMTLRLQYSRFLFFDFGPAVDCAGADPGTLACVLDKPDDNTFTDPVLCPFPPGDRDPADNSRCSGFRRVVMGFRHAFVDGAERYMLGMPNNVPYDGEGDNIEIDFREESNRDDDLRLRFDENCLGLNLGDYLEITARNNKAEDDDVLPNDEWHIGTGTGTRTACLTRKGNGKREYLVGLFDMQFGYTICILANPDAQDGVCL